MIQANMFYTLEELAQLLQISLTTLRRHKEDVFLHLEDFCNFEVTKQKAGNLNRKKEGVFILEVYEQPKPFPRWQKCSLQEDKEEFFESWAFPIILKDSLQTAQSIANILFNGKTEEEKKQFIYTELTFRRYLSDYMKKWFGTDNKDEDGNRVKVPGTKGEIGKRSFAVLNRDKGYYERLTDEQVKEFFKWVEKFNAENKQDLVNDLPYRKLRDCNSREFILYINNLILDAWIQARDEYNKKYGGIPHLYI